MHIYYQETLDITRGDHKLIFWRRITRVLMDLRIANKDMFHHNFDVIKPDNINEQHEARLAPAGRCTLHQSLTEEPAPEVVRVFGSMPVWPLAPGT